MTIRRGRSFTAADGPGAPRVIVVNEALSRKVWPGRDPVGQRLVLDYLRGAYPYEVVGVVNDTRFRGLKAAPRPEVFIPHAQNPYLDLSLVVRTAGEPESMLRTVQQEIRAIDPRQPAYGLVTMDQLVRRSVSADRFTMLVLALLAGVALVLAATGIYGVLSFLVAQRTSEIGLRLALGASPRQVVRLVMSETFRLALAGCALGLLISLAFVRLASGLLYGVAPTDPVAFGLALLFMAAVALAASLQPARRASRLDPLAALRAE
jgi:putative ABC transport system permease protein